MLILWRKGWGVSADILQRNTCFLPRVKGGEWLKRLFLLQKWFSVCALSPRDLPVVHKWRDGLRLWSRLVVTRGDDLRSAAWMGRPWLVFDFSISNIRYEVSVSLHPTCLLFSLSFYSFVILSQNQRPYDIHASNSVESLIQLFSTVSVQYNPAWPKDLVSLLRKVSSTAAFRETQLLWTWFLQCCWAEFVEMLMIYSALTKHGGTCS